MTVVVASQRSLHCHHTVFKMLLFSVGNHISDSGHNTLTNASRQLLRDARADARAAGLERIALLAAPKGYCWLRQRVKPTKQIYVCFEKNDFEHLSFYKSL